jgi:hypothetical protein
MKMPKVPTWGWVLLVLVGLWYIFLRERMEMPTSPAPTAVASDAKKKD